MTGPNVAVWPNMGKVKMVDDSDLSLVNRTKAGDIEAFSELARRHERVVYNLAYRFMRDAVLAEDMAQEAFLKAYGHLPEFKGDSKFYTWLVRIAVNESLMKLRKRKTGKTVSLDEEIDTGEETVTREIAVWE